MASGLYGHVEEGCTDHVLLDFTCSCQASTEHFSSALHFCSSAIAGWSARRDHPQAPGRLILNVVSNPLADFGRYGSLITRPESSSTSNARPRARTLQAMRASWQARWRGRCDVAASWPLRARISSNKDQLSE